ncbi:MAG: DMT family transporter [Armatimonadota bacterium]|nr:MAG: DMT family transporter [Armatimonadota bacterium]
MDSLAPVEVAPHGRHNVPVGAAWGVAMACFYSSVFLIWGRMTKVLPSPVVGFGAYAGALLVIVVGLLLAGRGEHLRPARRHWSGLLIIGAIGFTINASALAGIALSTATKAAILTRTDTFFAALLAVLFIGERLGRGAIPGLLLMFAGAGLSMDVRLSELTLPSGADLLFLVAALCLGLNAVIIKTRLRHLSRFTVAAFNIGVTMCLFAVLVTVGGQWGEVSRLVSPALGLPILLCGCLMVGSYISYYSALALLQSWEARSFSLLVPPIVGVASLILFGETVGGVRVAGMACVVAGALIVNRARSAEEQRVLHSGAELRCGGLSERRDVE